jgi:hypothetical protein
MAMPTCVKCDGHLFEVREVTPHNSNYVLMFVQCSGCGGVVGVMDFYNIGEILQKMKQKLNIS